MSRTIIPVDLACELIVEGRRRESGLPQVTAQAIADRYGVILGINGLAGLGTDPGLTLTDDKPMVILVPGGCIAIWVTELGNIQCRFYEGDTRGRFGEVVTVPKP